MMSRRIAFRILSLIIRLLFFFTAIIYNVSTGITLITNRKLKCNRLTSVLIRVEVFLLNSIAMALDKVIHAIYIINRRQE